MTERDTFHFSISIVHFTHQPCVTGYLTNPVLLVIVHVCFFRDIII